MMFSRKARREKAALFVMHHLDRIRGLQRERERHMKQRDRGRTLAINYEISANASEALEKLMRAESLSELGAVPLFPGDLVARVRRRLGYFRDLPAIPYHDLGSTPQEEMKRLWESWLDKHAMDLIRRREDSGPDELEDIEQQLELIKRLSAPDKQEGL